MNQRLRFPAHLALWLAFWLALGNAVLPTLLRVAAARGGGSEVISLCSAYGLKTLRLQHGDPASAPATATASHCPLCLSSQLAALPSPLLTLAFVPPRGWLAPHLPEPNPARPAFFHPAQPRAPPALA